MILAPLRGVTIRCFRETFAEEIRAAGFTEAVTPFITAAPGYDPLKDRELRGCDPNSPTPQLPNSPTPQLPNPPTSQLPNIPTPQHPNPRAPLLLTPQFIGKDPAALRDCLERVKGAGFTTADLNAGCPFPMVRNKGRGSGLLRTPDVLRRMLEVGCEVMGEGRFSLKTRLGVERKDELLALMPLVNAFPLRYLTVHARTAKQMYEGSVDRAAFAAVASVAKVPVVENGDIPFPPSHPLTPSPSHPHPLMLGRSFVRALGARDDARELLVRYLDASAAELCGDHSVLGRMKELLSYWQDLPAWRRLWPVLKICRTVEELRLSVR